jgi:hypothetical protein
MPINHVEHKNIDKNAWNNCIASAYNGNVYAWSWYLDIVSPNWNALVLDNYSAVMPLTWNKKYGITYIHQPFFTQQLGVFSRQSVTKEMLNEFVGSIPLNYRYAEISMNVNINREHFEIAVKDGITTHLDLIRNHTELRKNYNSNTLRNIKKAQKHDLHFQFLDKPNQIIDLFKSNKGKELKELKSIHYQRLEDLMQYGVDFKIASFPGVLDERGDLCAGGFFMFSHNKLVFLFGASNNIGKENGAMFLLFDNFIRQHSGKTLTIDFEGSTVPGVLRFYQGFGAKKLIYPIIKINRLPTIVKMFKR